MIHHLFYGQKTPFYSDKCAVSNIQYKTVYVDTLPLIWI